MAAMIDLGFIELLRNQRAVRRQRPADVGGPRGPCGRLAPFDRTTEASGAGRIADCDGAAVRNGAGRRTRRAEAPRMRSCYRPQHRADRVVIDWRFAIRRQAGWSGPADRRIAVAAGRHRARGESAQRRLQRHDLGDGQREGATWRLSLVDVRVSVRFVGSPGPRGHTSIEIQYVSRLIRLRNQPADLREPMPRIPVVDDDNRSASPRKAFPSRKATMSWSPNPAATASEPRTGLDRRQLG